MPTQPDVGLVIGTLTVQKRPCLPEDCAAFTRRGHRYENCWVAPSYSAERQPAVSSIDMSGP